MISNIPMWLTSVIFADGSVIRPATNIGAGLGTATHAFNPNYLGTISLGNTPIELASYIRLFPNAEPAGDEGRLYYDSTAHKLKVRGAAAWETISSA